MIRASLSLLSPSQRMGFEGRFWPKVNKTRACWVWQGALSKAGYGQILLFTSRKSLGKKLIIYAHRAAYEMLKGAIPDEGELDHVCRNPPCVNPDHLEAVSHRENDVRGNGPAGTNSRKTHCKHGHLLSGDNLSPARLKLGQRRCLTCERESLRKWRAKQ